MTRHKMSSGLILAALLLAGCGPLETTTNAPSAGRGVDPAAAQARLQLLLWREFQVQADAGNQPSWREPRTFASLQPGDAAMGR